MMDDIHIYLPDGRRVVIAVPSDSFYSCLYSFTADSQTRKWYGWRTLESVGITDTKITELEGMIDEIVCDLIDRYERRLAKEREKNSANTRLQAIFHGKVRDVKCPVREAQDGEAT